MTWASLPMYDLPEIRRANDAWWSGLAKWFRREGLVEVPGMLEWGHSAPSQEPPFFTQCCGFDLIRRHGELAVVATPSYASPHCVGGSYRSLIVVNSESSYQDLRQLHGARAVINTRCSHSGYTAFRHLLAPVAGKHRFFSEVRVSGTHAASLASVADGEADVTCVDCVTFALLERHVPTALLGLRILAESARAPGLPYVTEAATGGDRLLRLRAGLLKALEDPDLNTARDSLLIVGAENLGDAAYQRIGLMEQEADTLGFKELI